MKVQDVSHPLHISREDSLLNDEARRNRDAVIDPGQALRWSKESDSYLRNSKEQEDTAVFKTLESQNGPKIITGTTLLGAKKDDHRHSSLGRIEQFESL